MVDLSFLEKFTKGDTKKMRRYITLYLDVASKTFDEMDRNAENQDWEQLKINAHSLKPQADFMGIPTLKNVLIALEESSKVNDVENIFNHLRLAKSIHQDSAKLIKDILDSIKQ